MCVCVCAHVSVCLCVYQFLGVTCFRILCFGSFYFASFIFLFPFFCSYNSFWAGCEGFKWLSYHLVCNEPMAPHTCTSLWLSIFTHWTSVNKDWNYKLHGWIFYLFVCCPMFVSGYFLFVKILAFIFLTVNMAEKDSRYTTCHFLSGGWRHLTANWMLIGRQSFYVKHRENILRASGACTNTHSASRAILDLSPSLLRWKLVFSVHVVRGIQDESRYRIQSVVMTRNGGGGEGDTFGRFAHQCLCTRWLAIVRLAWCVSMLWPLVAQELSYFWFVAKFRNWTGLWWKPAVGCTLAGTRAILELRGFPGSVWPHSRTVHSRQGRVSES